jgi:hypothetical protein
MEPAKIQWSLGITKNLGNFESFRIDCQVIDSVREGESKQEASDRIYGFVTKELEEKFAKEMKGIKNG